MNVSPEIMEKIFDCSKNFPHELRGGDCLARSNIHSKHFGIKSMANIATKTWNAILTKSKKQASLVFKSKIKNVFHRVPLDLAKHMWD